jgi:diguanylate cyclase (GGDEF)-like protein
MSEFSHPPGTGAQARLRVLVVSEKVTDAVLVGTLLAEARECAIDTQPVTSLVEGLADIARSPPDLVLLDLPLTERSHLDTIATVALRHPSLAVVVWTDAGGAEMGVEAVKRGAQDVVVKGSVTANALARSLRLAVERKSLELKLRSAIGVDPVSGLPNRAWFVDRLRALLARRRRERRGGGALFVLDIDRLGVVNDTYGYAAGDDVIREAARRLAGVVREDDAVARLGGDEFGLLLEDLTAASAALDAGTRWLAVFGAPMETAAGRLPVTASAGCMLLHSPGFDAEWALACAEAATFTAKRAGGDTVTLYPRR